jgi:hypothetical protein
VQWSLLAVNNTRMLQSLTGLHCRYIPRLALLLFVLPFYNFLQALISPVEIVASLFLIVFVIGVICGALPLASVICKNNFRLYDLPLNIFISLHVVYLVQTSPSWMLLVKHGFWLVFSVYVYYYYADTKKSNESKHVLSLLYFASLIIAFAFVVDNFNKLVLRNPAFFDAIIYTLKGNQDTSLDPHHLSYRATGLLGSRALTTGFVGLGGLAGLALFWRSRGGGVLSLHSVLLLFCFGLTAFIGFQLAVLVLLILSWSRDRFSGFLAYLLLVALVASAIILFDLLVFPWIASISPVTDPDGMPRSVVATFMALVDQQRNAILTFREVGIIGSYSEQLRAYVGATGLLQLLIGIGASGVDSGFVLGWDWGWLDWIARIGIVGAGTIIYLFLRSILSSGKLLHAAQSNLSFDDVDDVVIKRFVFLASVFLLLTSFHYEILLTREMLPFYFYLLALSKYLSSLQ